MTEDADECDDELLSTLCLCCLAVAKFATLSLRIVTLLFWMFLVTSPILTFLTELCRQCPKTATPHRRDRGDWNSLKSKLKNPK